MRNFSIEDFRGFKSCKTKRNIYYKFPNWLGKILYEWKRK